MTAVFTYSSLIDTVILYATQSGNTDFISLVPTFINLAEVRCAREVKNLGTKKIAVSNFTPSNGVYAKPARWRETASINFGTASSYETVTRAASGTTRTITFSVPHGFSTGSGISVFNVSGSGYNGDFNVTAITQTGVSYLSSSGTETATSDTGGIVTAPLNDRTPIYPREYEWINAYWPNRSLTGTPVYYADYDYSHFIVVPTPIYAAPFELTYYETPDQLSPSNQTNWLTQYAPDLILYATLLETAPYLRNDPRIQTWQTMYDRSAAAISGETKAQYQDASINRSEG